MKSLLSITFICFLLFSTAVQAQLEYTVNGEIYTLKTEIEGPLTLLWNTIDGEYRYFLKKDDLIEELTNTKQEGKFKEEFRNVLQRHTADANIPTKKVNLTLPSLHNFFSEYNKERDPSFTENRQSSDLKLRLGVFAGVDNTIFNYNPANSLHPLVGVDLELIDAVKLKRHAMVLRFEQTFENSDHKYSASQFSLNYRFKFVKTSKLDVFVNAKFAALTFSSRTTSFYETPNSFELITYKESGTAYSVPFTFGIGADYKVGNGFITFNYNDIVGLNVASNKEFPVNFTLGYKFNL